LSPGHLILFVLQGYVGPKHKVSLTREGGGQSIKFKHYQGDQIGRIFAQLCDCFLWAVF
jgi:hypothetical protein